MRIAMKKYVIVVLVLLCPALLFSQEVKKDDAAKEQPKVITNIPVEAQYSNSFAIKNLFFNKRTDYSGKGEILEIEFILENLTDDPMDLYVFTIATFEKVEKTKSSLERPVPIRERIRTFVTFPDDISNFSYPDTDGKGNIKKDKNGLEIVKLVKFPKNPKAGVDPKTGKPYHLDDKLTIYTTHLSKYKRNYFFFNNLAVLIFDSEGKPAYRKLFVVKGKRNR
jgi:hypothetical protein